MQNQGVKHYRSNKKTYYINLRSNDANVITTTPPGNVPNNVRFQWTIKNINLSRQARMCLTSMHFEDSGVNPDPILPVTIRCPQVQNTNVFDSGNGPASLIYIGNMLHLPVIENWYPISGQSLDRIELIFSNNITNLNSGIATTLQFYIQLKIEDYDTEEVNPSLMPTYTPDSLSFHYGLNV